jgi:hypothetical protein
LGKLKATYPLFVVTGAATCTRSVLKKEMHLSYQHVATASWRKEGKSIPPIIGIAER